MILKVVPQDTGMHLVILKRTRLAEGPTSATRGTPGLALEQAVSVNIREMRKNSALFSTEALLESA